MKNELDLYCLSGDIADQLRAYGVKTLPEIVVTDLDDWFLLRRAGSRYLVEGGALSFKINGITFRRPGRNELSEWDFCAEFASGDA